MAQLEPIADGLWEASHDLYIMGFVHFRGRMTVIRLGDGSLVLHSPVPIDDALAQELAELGEVRHLVAPNLFHHLHVAAAKARYPKAKAWGAPGFDTKRADLQLVELTGDAPAAWRNDLDQVVLGGCPLVNEVVFLHRASGTVLVTDLVFNVHEVGNWLSQLVFRMVGAWSRCAMSRLLRSQVKDRAALASALEHVLAWEFDRLVMAHGQVIHDGGKQALREATAWLRPARKALAA